jgi:hypothetical protein
MDDGNLLPAMDAPPPLTPTPPVEPERNEILYGPNGLRAGWRALLFMIIVVCIVALINVVGHYLTRKLGQTPAVPAQLTTLTPGFIAAGEFNNVCGNSWRRPNHGTNRAPEAGALRASLAYPVPEIFLGRIVVGISGD